MILVFSSLENINYLWYVEYGCHEKHIYGRSLVKILFIRDREKEKMSWFYWLYQNQDRFPSLIG